MSKDEGSPIPVTGEIVPREPKVNVKRIRHKQAIEKAEMYAARNLPKYIKLIEGLAAGVLVQETTKAGEVIFRTPPDLGALKYLTDRGMGKPTDKTEITGEDGSPIVVTPWIPRSSGCCRDDGNEA